MKKQFRQSDKTIKKREDKPFKKGSNKTYKSKQGFSKHNPKKNIVKSEEKPVIKLTDSIRLNKYIANSGICSRREADVFIKAGNVKVNGEVMTEMGYQVLPGDEVRFDNEVINPEVKRYVLLNKPKDFITTMDDDRGRKTVMELVSKATKERIYPVGRLDRKTTGLLLFTNDGELAKKLTHPKHNIRKIYHVVLDKNLKASDLKSIADPQFKVEDFPVYVDSISYIESTPKNEIGIEIHSGRNRIIRKIFESLNYKVVKLDRVIFAGLDKKDLPRGKWRHLTQQEVINLKNIK